MTMFETKPIAFAFSFGFSTVIPPDSAIEALSTPALSPNDEAAILVDASAVRLCADGTNSRVAVVPSG